MKAITAVCATGASVPAIANGRISRHRDGENAEIQMYLTKLKDLVPFMPKNRKLSKLEIIQYVIDYICDLQSELEMHPAVNNFDPAAALNDTIQNIPPATTQQQLNGSNQRQPLCDRSNPINCLASNSSSNSESNNNNTFHHHQHQSLNTTPNHHRSQHH